ncbi:MAG: hypothetical protein Q8L48_37645 [Archangium sp.]|nr:hypothetical protein [Archangium sp.]
MLLLSLSLLLITAQAGEGSFHWSAPETCPDEASLRARVGWTASRVDAVVAAQEDGFELTVSIDGQVRTLKTPSCREAADTTVFLVELVGRTTSPSRKVVAPPPTAEARLAAIPEEPPRPRLHLSLLGGAEWLLLPRPVPRFGASVQLELQFVTLTLDVRTAPPLRFGSASPSGLAIDLAPALDVQAGVCHLFSLGPVQAGPCAQVGVGAVWALGVNVPFPRSPVVAVWTAGPALRLAIALGSLFELQAFAAARFGPRPAYYFEGMPPAIETSALGVDTGLGLGARW